MKWWFKKPKKLNETTRLYALYGESANVEHLNDKIEDLSNRVNNIPQPDLTNLAKLNQANTFTSSNRFNGETNFFNTVNFRGYRVHNPRPPTSNDDIVHKEYVDNQITAVNNRINTKADIAGNNTFTGNNTFQNNVNLNAGGIINSNSITADNSIVNKAYVDNKSNYYKQLSINLKSNTTSLISDVVNQKHLYWYRVRGTIQIPTFTNLEPNKEYYLTLYCRSITGKKAIISRNGVMYSKIYTSNNNGELVIPTISDYYQDFGAESLITEFGSDNDITFNTDVIILKIGK